MRLINQQELLKLLNERTAKLNDYESIIKEYSNYNTFYKIIYCYKFVKALIKKYKGENNEA